MSRIIFAMWSTWSFCDYVRVHLFREIPTEVVRAAFVFVVDDFADT